MTQQLRCDVDEADMLNAAFWMTEVASASAMVMTAAEGDGGFTMLDGGGIDHCCCTSEKTKTDKRSRAKMK